MKPVALYNPNDFCKEEYVKWVAVKPNQLSQPALEVIRTQLTKSLVDTVDANYGFILRVGSVTILDNKIGDGGNVEYRVKMTITCLRPLVGMIFISRIITILPEGCIINNPHFQNLLIGGEKREAGYLVPCGCLLEIGALTGARIDAVIFQHGRYTCICQHVCHP